MPKLSLVTGILLIATSHGAWADIVKNGSFETFGGSGASNIGAGIEPWVIGGGGIDIMEPSHPNYWEASDGQNSISINWNQPGWIEQTVTTTPGQVYAVRFDMAAEIYGGQPLRSLNVAWNGVVVGSPSIAYAGQGPTSMGWTEFVFYVEGTGLDTIAFLSTTPGNYGPTLDNVSLTPLCYADCDQSGSLDFFDFLCFQNEFGAGTTYADCDQSGSLDFFDFLCFQNAFSAGCP